MSKYAIEKKINSCFVPKKLILEIENYIIDKVKTLNELNEKDSYIDFEIIIKDPFGSEKIQSIKKYQRDDFPNDIIGIKLSYCNYSGKHLKEITVRLEKDYYYSGLEVNINDSNSKEIANGIISSLEKTIKEYGNFNFIFHGKYSFIPYLFFGTSYVFSLAFKDTGYLPLGVICFTALIMAILFLFFAKLNPYCFFDTKKNNKYKKIVHWILLGILGVLIFGGLTKLIWQ